VAWEFYYGVAAASTAFECLTFLGWLIADSVFVCVAVIYGTREHRLHKAKGIFLTDPLFVGLHSQVARSFSNLDATAYFTGFAEQCRLS